MNRKPPSDEPSSDRGGQPAAQDASQTGSQASWLAPRLRLKQCEEFCRRIGIGLRSGVDLMRLLEMERKLGGGKTQDGIQGVYDQLRSGDTLSGAMAAQGTLFPPLLIQMVAAGESGGSLDRVFLYMADHYRDTRQARNNFIQQMTWPAIQLLLGLLVVTGVILLQGFLGPANPQEGMQFDASGLGLRGVSGALTFWGYILAVAAVVGLIVWGIWKNWFGCQEKLMPWVRKIPVIGTVFTTLAMARMSMTMSLLLNAGVDARRVAKESFASTGNSYYQRGSANAYKEIARGQSFAQAMRAAETIPKEFIDSLEVGELSGTETDSLERLASDYQERSKAAMQALASTASYTLWVLIGMFLAFMIIRMAMQYINLLNEAVRI
jgi:type IV pilus assembly protein PilC